MGYALPRGSTRYRGAEFSSRDHIEKGAKPAPRVPVKMPRPVKIPPPPSQNNSPKQ